MGGVVIITATGRRFWFAAGDLKAATAAVQAFRFAHRGEIVSYAMYCRTPPVDVPFEDVPVYRPPLVPPPDKSRPLPRRS